MVSNSTPIIVLPFESFNTFSKYESNNDNALSAYFLNSSLDASMNWLTTFNIPSLSDIGHSLSSLMNNPNNTSNPL